jgi:hypothetical protein
LAANGASPADSSPQGVLETVLRFPAVRLTTWYRIAEIARHRGVLPETKFRDADTYGAMLITASTSGITFEFWSQDGKKLDSHTVPKACR